MAALVFIPSPQYQGIRAGPADIYPPVPGATNPNITQANITDTICNPNWSTKSIRPPASYTTALKKKQLVEFGYADTKLADYEEDHLVSLELGGDPKDPNNLWPEKYTASVADGGARSKDQVENELHREVCAGTITLAQAQTIITTDWYAFYLQMKKQVKYGSVEPQSDPDDEVDNVGTTVQ